MMNCSLCEINKCSNCNFVNGELKINHKIICVDCVSKLCTEMNNTLLEELDVKDQINLNLKKGLEDQLQIISRCKYFITTLEEVLSFQGLWTRLCDVEDNEEIQSLLYESQTGIQTWNQKNRQLETENSNLKSQINQQKINISILESHLKDLREDYKSSKETIESLKKIKFEKDHLKSIANETTSLVEKFKMENDGLRIRCFRLEQRVKELTNNYGYKNLSNNEPVDLSIQLRTLSMGIQENYRHSIMENSTVIFNNYQLLNCVESLFYHFRQCFCFWRSNNFT